MVHPAEAGLSPFFSGWMDIEELSQLEATPFLALWPELEKFSSEAERRIAEPLCPGGPEHLSLEARPHLTVKRRVGIERFPVR